MKKNKILIIFSLIESFLQVYGYLLYLNKGITRFNLLYLLIVVILTIPFYFFNKYLFKLLELKFKKNSRYKYSWKSFLLTWAIIFLLWIPVLLAYYPTLWAYDVYAQVPHLVGKPVSVFHPIFHTLFIELFLSLGHMIKDYEFGMLLLSIVQMLIMSAIFSYSLEKIKTVIRNKTVRIITMILLIIYFGLIPFNSIMSISMTKDVLFTGFLLLLIIYTYDILDGDKSTRKKVLFILASILTLLFKNNALFIYIIFLGVLIFTYHKEFFKLCLISISSFFAISIIMVLLLNPVGDTKYEGLSVVVQNLIYTEQQHPNIKKEDMYISVMPIECSNDKRVMFTKNRADASKTYFINCDLQRDTEYLIKVWLYYGFKYPGDYLDSWSNLTIGSWYLFDESHANTYMGYNTGYLLSDYKVIKGVSKERPKSKWPWLYEKLEDIATNNIQYRKATVFRFLFVPATYVLSFFLLIVFIIKHKMKKELIPLSLLLALYASILTGPVIIVRYIYPFMVIVPLLFVRLMNKKREA